MSNFEPNTYAANTVLVLGIFPTLVGLNSVLRPGHALGLLGFPTPAGSEDKKLTHSLVQMSGVRTITMGLTTIVTWFLADEQTLGYVLLAQAPVAVIDGFISKWQIGAMEWGHWGVLPITLGLASRLIGWI